MIKIIASSTVFISNYFPPALRLRYTIYKCFKKSFLKNVSLYEAHIIHQQKIEQRCSEIAQTDLEVFNMWKTIKWLGGLCFILLLSSILVGWWLLTKSLPLIDGEQTLSGLKKAVIIERDDAGIPTIKAHDRQDVALALGFIHSQERFFQMDLLRRNAAGELSELFGKAALQHDKANRIFLFRHKAKNLLTHLPNKSLNILKAYTEGVNQGINALSSPPFEYWLLSHTPKPWTMEDSILCLYSMYLDLQFQDARRERSLATLQKHLPEDWYEFLKPQEGYWQAPLIPSPQDPLPISLPSTPWPSFLTTRHHTTKHHTTKQYKSKQHTLKLHQFSKIYDTSHENEPSDPRQNVIPDTLSKLLEAPALGSNNWAVTGDYSDTGSGLLANDMHLSIRVPNVWFRAQWKIHATDIDMQSPDHQAIGVTLPGTPPLIVGSNSKVAWGFTNAMYDVSDVIILNLNSSQTAYKTQDGWKPLEKHQEKFVLPDQSIVYDEVITTQWGPVISKTQSQWEVLKWVALEPQGANLKLLDLEKAETTAQALEIAPTLGIPLQNFMVADHQGAIGWTLAGPLVSRNGFKGDLPADWSKGYHAWKFLDKKQYPKVFASSQERLWSANSRTAAEDDTGALLDSGLSLGARARQIRDQLFDQNHFTEKDFLAIQMDNRALLLKPWKQLLLKTSQSMESPYKELIKDQLLQWQETAEKDSVAYRLVRDFRKQILINSIGQIYQYLIDSPDYFKVKGINQRVEYPLWALAHQQPQHLIPPGFKSWDEFFLKMADLVVNHLTLNGEISITQSTWGQYNTPKIQHPLSKFIPLLGWLTDMPSEPMGGDLFMPKIQTITAGASQRLVVSPGHEERGIFHMPSGQSGHPLSPYYGKGHQDWVKGRASPLLPGDSRWVLNLRPKSNY